MKDIEERLDSADRNAFNRAMQSFGIRIMNDKLFDSDCLSVNVHQSFKQPITQSSVFINKSISIMNDLNVADDGKQIYHCPFHTDKFGSFAVHEGRFNCFGCGVSGGLDDFKLLLVNLEVAITVYS